MSLLVLQMDRNCTRINQPLCTFLTQKHLPIWQVKKIVSRGWIFLRLNYQAMFLKIVASCSSQLSWTSIQVLFRKAVSKDIPQPAMLTINNSKVSSTSMICLSLSYIHPSKHHLVGKASCAGKQTRKNMLLYVWCFHNCLSLASFILQHLPEIGRAS